MEKIRVDVDELIGTLNEMKEDDYSTVELEVEGDGYYNQLTVSAVSLEEPDPIPYGSLAEVRNEFD